MVVLGFGVLNAIHSGAWFTLGPARAKETIGEQGWGLVLSAEAVGLLLMTLIMLRVPLKRPLLLGMLGISLLGLPILMLGAYPHLAILMIATFVAGAGTEVFSMGWNLAMQEHVPDEMLSRAYSYDALGSFVAIPVGQIAFGPAGRGVRLHRRAGRQRHRVLRDLPARAAVELGTATSPTADHGRRDRRRPRGQHHFCASARITVTLRLVRHTEHLLDGAGQP